jgi:hypothetical protein
MKKTIVRSISRKSLRADAAGRPSFIAAVSHAASWQLWQLLENFSAGQGYLAVRGLQQRALTAEGRGDA